MENPQPPQLVPPFLIRQSNPQVLLNITASVAQNMRVLIVTSTGMYDHTIATIADRVQASFTFPVAEVPWTIHLELAAPQVARGQVYANIRLRVGPFTNLQLAQGYITAYTPLSWPPGKFQPNTQWPGYLRTQLGDDPAAGANCIYIVPTGARQRIHSIKATLTAVGANTPTVGLIISRGANEAYRLISPLVQPAGTPRTYIWSAHSLLNEITFDAYDQLHRSLQHLELSSTDRITLYGQDADDNWGAPTAFVEELIQD